ncbi:hypothetical protein DFJ74DRAFT_663936 [Hyaloraphidium curvatum]|nr:hypothetical protein DFJ74DRAFT_663936 [Hyaloraphidium curvatum]
MVLQHDEPTIWGTSDPGATVQTLIFRDGDKAAGKVYQTAVRADGFWKVDLDPVAPSSGLVSYAIEVSTAGSAAILLEDVLFGVVFGCFGQSNMVMSASQTEESYTEAQLSNGLLRVFQAGNTIWYGNPNSSVPRSLIPTDTIYTSPGAPGWAVASRESIMGKEWTAFSATCFAFGTTLDEAFRRHVPDKRVPIGLMSIAVSGTSIQAWSSAQALKGCPQPVAPTYEEVPDVFDASILYNGLVQPLALGPLPFEGLAFYQGETNAEAGFAHAGDYYKCQLTATLSDMLTRFTKPRTRRTPWMGYVQITPFVAINAFAEPVLRNSQQNAIDELQRRFPQIGVSMVTAIDLGDADSRCPGAIAPCCRAGSTIPEPTLLSGLLARSCRLRGASLSVS